MREEKEPGTILLIPPGTRFKIGGKALLTSGNGGELPARVGAIRAGGCDSRGAWARPALTQGPRQSATERRKGTREESGGRTVSYMRVPHLSG